MNHVIDSFASGAAPVAPVLSTPERAQRHDGWTDEKREGFLEALRGLRDIGSAAASVGMGRSSAYALKRRDAEFSDAWDDALQEGLDHVRGLAFASATRTLSTEKYDSDGNLRHRSEKPNDRMLIFLLNKYDHHAYEDYGRRPGSQRNNQIGYERAVRREGAYEYWLEPIGPDDLGPRDVEEGLSLLERNRQYQAELKAKLQELEEREAALKLREEAVGIEHVPTDNTATDDDAAYDYEAYDSEADGDDDDTPSEAAPSAENPAPSPPTYQPIPGQTIATLRKECSAWLEGAVGEATALAAIARSAAQSGEIYGEIYDEGAETLPHPEIEGHAIRPRRYTMMDYDRAERDVIFLLWWSVRFGIAKDDPVYPRDLLDALNRDVDISCKEIEAGFLAMRDHPSVRAVPGHWAPLT